MKITKSLKESCLLMKRISETTKNESKKQKGLFLPIILGTLAASVVHQFISWCISRRRINKCRWSQNYSRPTVLMAPLPLAKFEIQNCCQNEPNFDGFYSWNNLSKIKFGAYIINLDEYESIGTHCLSLYVNTKNVTYFDSFRVEHIPKKLENSLELIYYHKYL